MSNDIQKIYWYVDPMWRHDNMAHSPFLYPFWGIALSERTPFQRALFERREFDTTVYEITDDSSKASVVFMPYAHNVVRTKIPELYEQCLARAREFGVPLVVDGVGDIEYPINDTGVVVIRYGGYRFTNKGNEIFIPAYANDLLDEFFGGKLQLRKKSKRAVVGFAGWAHVSPVQRLRTVVKELPDRVMGLFDSRYRARSKGVLFREKALAILENSDLISLNTIRRPSYSGHVQTVSGDIQMLRKQYVENSIQSDYCLDIRGDGNASMRLFESLSLGRIPVIIDTERNFPFVSEISYNDFALVVDFRDLRQLPERIAQFHNSLTPEQFESIQYKAREMFVNYFRVDAIMHHLVKELRSRFLTS